METGLFGSGRSPRDGQVTDKQYFGPFQHGRFGGTPVSSSSGIGLGLGGQEGACLAFSPSRIPVIWGGLVALVWPKTAAAHMQWLG